MPATPHHLDHCTACNILPPAKLGSKNFWKVWKEDQLKVIGPSDQIEDNLKNEDNVKNEDDLKNKDNLKNEAT